MTTATPTPTALKRIRYQQGYSQRRLGRVLGVSHEAVRRWEQGAVRPHPRWQARLEDVLGVPIAEILAPAKEKGAGANGPDAQKTTAPATAKQEDTSAAYE